MNRSSTRSNVADAVQSVTASARTAGSAVADTAKTATTTAGDALSTAGDVIAVRGRRARKLAKREAALRAAQLALASKHAKQEAALRRHHASIASTQAKKKARKQAKQRGGSVLNRVKSQTTERAGSAAAVVTGNQPTGTGKLQRAGVVLLVLAVGAVAFRSARQSQS